jgi:flagellar biogenesis protein FliO
MTVLPDFTSSALNMLTALATVLVGLGALYFVAKRFLNRSVGGPSDQLVRVLGSHYVGVKKQIALVEVPGAVLVVGVTNDRMRLLDKIEDPVLLDQIRSRSEGEAGGFSAQLTKLTDRFKSLNRNS